MPIREEALNAALAEALKSRGLHATPEQTRRSTGRKRCDVQARNRQDDHYYAAVECKIGQEEPQRRAVVRDAMRWLKQRDCWHAVAVCYPRSLADDSPEPLVERLQKARFAMARVAADGVAGEWLDGNLAVLAELVKDIPADHSYIVADKLEGAIAAASDALTEVAGKYLAAALQLPWEPKRSNIDPRPARIGCLILANMALLHNRLQSEGIRIDGLQPLMDIHSAGNKQVFLFDNWRRIRAVDYGPVVDPALAVVRALPMSYGTETAIGILAGAVFECIPHIRGLQLDHAGPLYHQLLETARYDGSFYTGPAAAVLLAELAMPERWAPAPDWSDANALARLRVCDPACGTGTLLLAAARAIEERFVQSGGRNGGETLEALHLSLVEDVLHGLDINRHAIHLAACMLTLSAPKIDYNKMSLYNMQHGVNGNKEVRAGSLDILTDSAAYLPGLAPDTDERRAASEDYRAEAPALAQACDLVIMNPPFTRNDIRNRSLADPVRRRVQKHEIGLVGKIEDETRRNAIDQSTIGTFFTPIADVLLNDKGTLAIVKPFTSCTNASGKGERTLLTDPERFHLELVVTSHDNRHISFSENTDIHESLIVARRPTAETRERRTAFVSLAENPASISGGRQLARAIRAALDGDMVALSAWGTIAWRTEEQVRNRPWNAACFYDQSLADACDALSDNAALAPVCALAAVGPGGQRVRDAFRKARQRQNPDMRALWHNKADRQTAMRTGPDEFLVPTPRAHRTGYDRKLWAMRGHLLLANRMRANLAATPAVWSDEPILGSAFIPVTPRNGNGGNSLFKAWCAWLNSSAGVLSFLNIRQKNLTYPHFSLDGLRTLPVPHPERCDIAALAAAFDRLADTPLRALPEMDRDDARRALDEAAAHAVPGVEAAQLANWRRRIPLEPAVNNRRAGFRLT